MPPSTLDRRARDVAGCWERQERDDVGHLPNRPSGTRWGRPSRNPAIVPARTPAPVVRMPIAGVGTIRYTVLVVDDGEHLSVDGCDMPGQGRL
jgi:hypothetical protein